MIPASVVMMVLNNRIVQPPRRTTYHYTIIMHQHRNIFGGLNFDLSEYFVWRPSMRSQHSIRGDRTFTFDISTVIVLRQQIPHSSSTSISKYPADNKNFFNFNSFCHFLS